MTDNGSPVDTRTQGGRQRILKASTSSAEAGKSDGHRTKRTRVSRACDQCRASRERCDGAQPKCQTCNAQNRACSYNEQPKKRGIQPNYIRTLEMVVAWLLQTSPESSHALLNHLASSDGSTFQALAGKDASLSDALHQRWRESLLCTQIDQMLSGAPIDKPSSPEFETVEMSFDGDNDVDPSPQSKTAPDGSLHAPKLKLPEQAWTLLEHYFAFTHCWLPMTDKASLLKLMYACPNEGILQSACGSRHAELWSILALAALQVREGNDTYHNQYKGLSETAWRLISDNLGSPVEIGHVRASLIVALFYITERSYLAAWLAVGFAVRLLVAFDACHDTKIRHVSLVAFVLEHALVSHLGLPAYLPNDRISAALVGEDGLDEWSPWHDPQGQSGAAKAPSKACSTLNRLVRIASRQSHFSRQGPDVATVVFALAHNAAKGKDRLQPTLIVDQCEASFDVNQLQPRGPSTPKQMPDTTPFLSIPNDSEKTYSPSLGTSVALTPSNNTGQAGLAAHGIDTDIFEELAMLERSDSTQNPQFMQNLGFGPDLDLADFFGADYQPSDPLLAYMQPSVHKSSHSDVQADADPG